MGNIFWLASYPKSGNTWMRAFIANLIAGGTQALGFDDWNRYATDDALPERYERLAGAAVGTLDIERICALRAGVQAQISAQVRGTVFVKTHSLAGSYAGHPLQHWAVCAGGCYVVRNPLDVAVSFAAHFGLSLDESIERLADPRVATATDRLFVGQILGSWSQHVAGWAALESRNVLVVRYEDMCEKPLKAFGRVARTLGLDGDRGRVQRAIDFSAFGQMQRMEREHGFREAVAANRPFFRAGRMHQWRERLSRAQVARVVADHHETMRRFKYLPAGF